MITVIPAIDIIDGNCVRLTEGDFSTKKVYYPDPLDAAQLIEDCGLTHLHLVDLDNAKSGQVKSLSTLERICNNTGLIVDYGGGIKTKDDINAVINAGAKQVNCGSIALKDPDIFGQWIEEFGGKIILSADAKNNKISTAGWQDDSEIELENFIRIFEEKGLSFVTSTDISKDGRLAGPAFIMYESMRRSFPKLNICASGGVATMGDIEALNAMRIDRVIVGKAIYEGVITMGDLSNYVNNA